MPYYRIIITLRSGEKNQGIRLMEVWNPDTALRMVEKMANDHYGESRVKLVEVMMLPKSSDEVKRYLAGLGRKK
jgi:hypothetical protein